MISSERLGVELFWLPLGAGGRFIRANGRLYEALTARLERRPACDLYHSALVVRTGDGRYAIEQAPVWQTSVERGVVAEGAVGSRWAGRMRLFRYEVRCWRDGVIPDLDEAVESPQPLTDDEAAARLVLELVQVVPTPVWGRDELGAGEMWNSNSLIAWLIVRAGLPLDSARLPRNGRAPGWDAGVTVALRSNPG